MDRRAWTMLLCLGAIWGASYLLIKIGLRDLSPGMVAWGRVVFAAVVLIALAARRSALGGFGAVFGWVVLVAAAQVAGPFVLIAAGEQEISSSLAGILVASAPLFTALLAIWFDADERAEGMRLVGVLLGVAGVGLLLGVDLVGSGDELLGGLAVLLAGLGYAIGGLLAKHRLADRPPIGVAAWVLVAATLPAVARSGRRDPGVDPRARPGRGGGGAWDRGHRDRLRHLLRADRNRRPGADLHRHLPRAGVRGRLRRDAARRAFDRRR